MASRIMQEAYNRGSMDNLAVIVVDLATQSDQDGPVGLEQPSESIDLVRM